MSLYYTPAPLLLKFFGSFKWPCFLNNFLNKYYIYLNLYDQSYNLKNHVSLFSVLVFYIQFHLEKEVWSYFIFPLICHPLWHFIAWSCYCLPLHCVLYMNPASSMSRLLNTLLDNRHQTLSFFSYSLCYISHSLHIKHTHTHIFISYKVYTHTHTHQASKT